MRTPITTGTSAVPGTPRSPTETASTGRGADRAVDLEVTRTPDDGGTYDVRIVAADGSSMAVMLDATLANDLWCELGELFDESGGEDELEIRGGDDVLADDDDGDDDD